MIFRTEILTSNLNNVITYIKFVFVYGYNILLYYEYKINNNIKGEKKGEKNEKQNKEYKYRFNFYDINKYLDFCVHFIN